jgi:hypothetical protein
MLGRFFDALFRVSDVKNHGMTMKDFNAHLAELRHQNYPLDKMTMGDLWDLIRAEESFAEG